MALDVVAAGERAVDPVHDEGHDEPEEHHAPVLLHRLEHGEDRPDGSGGGEKMDGKGFVGVGHGVRDAASRRSGQAAGRLRVCGAPVGFSRPMRLAGPGRGG
jgi:hypothetical protein